MGNKLIKNTDSPSQYVTKRSFKCKKCKKIKYSDCIGTISVKPTILDPPKCKCGNKMTETQNSVDRIRKLIEVIVAEDETIRCKGCGRKFIIGNKRLGDFLAIHLSRKRHEDCKKLYEQEGYQIIRDEQLGSILERA